MTVNLESFLVHPRQGDSYWFGVDLWTFKAVGENTGERYALFEVLIMPQGGTPPHIHGRENESFYVQEGELEFKLDTEIINATAGTFLFSPKGQLHSFTNTTANPAKILLWVTPAGFEKFVAEVSAVAKDPIAPAPPLNPEDLERIVTVARKYGVEILPPQSQA